jgi:uncharacterized protein (DUF1800 family)
VKRETEDPWAAYHPNSEAPWNRRRVIHLHRRAGFAASWAEIERDLQHGPAASIARVLEGRARAQSAPEDFGAVSAALADGAISANDPERLKAWWVFRMLCGPDPLGERLTLLWHDHFATSNQKVDDLAAMRRQNELFRTLGRAPFGELLGAAVRDPALLVWLDAPANRKGHPNENLARELMELFSLGIGNYSEVDVKEAARALTGWTVADGKFREASDEHDAGEKVIFGRKRRWTGAELIDALVEMPATALRLARRLCGLFFGELGPDEKAVRSLAAGLRERGLDVGWGVGTILRSRAFFAESNIGTRVLCPVDYIVGATIALGRTAPPPSTLVLADWIARLGQDLFYPPNVGGWPGGRSWLSSRSLIGRANFASGLVEGVPAGIPAPLDTGALADAQGRSNDCTGVINAAATLLFGNEPEPAWRDAIEQAWADRAGAGRSLRAVALVLGSPEAQLG